MSAEAQRKISQAKKALVGKEERANQMHSVSGCTAEDCSGSAGEVGEAEEGGLANNGPPSSVRHHDYVTATKLTASKSIPCPEWSLLTIRRSEYRVT
jgi:hypothetical protein